jgi:hypothetical protein
MNKNTKIGILLISGLKLKHCLRKPPSVIHSMLTVTVRAANLMT